MYVHIAMKTTEILLIIQQNMAERYVHGDGPSTSIYPALEKLQHYYALGLISTEVELRYRNPQEQCKLTPYHDNSGML